MRTTLTLDEDVAAQVKESMAAEQRTFKETVNHLLRIGLDAERKPRETGAFKVRAKDLGGGSTGIDFSNIGEVLERFEGPDHR